MEPLTHTPWPVFQEGWAKDFRQGQHVTVIGPTDCGKTTLVTELIKPRGHVVLFGVKHVDESMSKLQKQGWSRTQSWKDRPKTNRVLLWPKVPDLDKVENVQRAAFDYALKDIYKVGGWCCWWDELRYMADHLGMRKRLTQMYVTARSNKISLVGNTQRPSWVPLEAYSQAGHLILFRTGDERDLERIGSLNGQDSRFVSRTVSTLPHRHFLHVNLNNGELHKSKLELPKGG